MVRCNVGITMSLQNMVSFRWKDTIVSPPTIARLGSARAAKMVQPKRETRRSQLVFLPSREGMFAGSPCSESGHTVWNTAEHVGPVRKCQHKSLVCFYQRTVSSQHACALKADCEKYPHVLMAAELCCNNTEWFPSYPDTTKSSPINNWIARMQLWTGSITLYVSPNSHEYSMNCAVLRKYVPVSEGEHLLGGKPAKTDK